MSEDPLPTDPAPGNRDLPESDGGGSPGGTPTSPGLWERVRHLEWDARWLAAKCDELQLSSCDLLKTVGPPGPLTPAQVRLVETDPPTRPLFDVFDEYHRLRDERAAGPGTVPPGVAIAELAERAAGLERTVAAHAARREQLRPVYLALIAVVAPYEPITEEELHDLLHGPRGPSMREIIEEVERELQDLR